jgi:transposase
MYVALGGPKGYETVTVREDVYDPATGGKSTTIVRKVGKLSDLLAEDPDFMARLKEEVRLETLALKEAEKPILLPLGVGPIEEPSDATPTFSFGHAVVDRLWELLALDVFFEKHCTRKNADSLIRAVRYLVSHRCIAPDSIRSSALGQKGHAGVTPLALEVLYTVLDVLSEHKDALVAHLGKQFRKKTKRKRDIACYDVTTYSFESTKWGELRLFGFSKEHKNNEVQVVMGLLIDNNGIPIDYEIFPGNTMEQHTLRDSVGRLRALYGLGEITVVADRGMNGGDNLLFLTGNGYHFVVSYTLKRSRAEFKEAVLGSEVPWQVEHYSRETGELEYASKVLGQKVTARVELTEEELEQAKQERRRLKMRGRTPKYRTIEIDAAVHVTYSKKRADRDFAGRMRVLDRLAKKLENPATIRAAIRKGGNQYLQIDLDGQDFTIDEGRVAEAARYDGYYAVVTDRLDLTTEQAMEIYRGQWKIEESFRVLKTDLRARPVFVWTDEHIKGHFVMCYLALTLVRYLQYLMDEAGWDPVLSAEEIMGALRRPQVVVQGESPRLVATPINVSQEYLDIAGLLQMKQLRQNMTVTQFRSATKLDLNKNLL